MNMKFTNSSMKNGKAIRIHNNRQNHINWKWLYLGLIFYVFLMVDKVFAQETNEKHRVPKNESYLVACLDSFEPELSWFKDNVDSIADETMGEEFGHLVSRSMLLKIENLIKIVSNKLYDRVIFDEKIGAAAKEEMRVRLIGELNNVDDLLRSFSANSPSGKDLADRAQQLRIEIKKVRDMLK